MRKILYINFLFTLLMISFFVLTYSSNLQADIRTTSAENLVIKKLKKGQGAIVLRIRPYLTKQSLVGSTDRLNIPSLLQSNKFKPSKIIRKPFLFFTLKKTDGKNKHYTNGPINRTLQSYIFLLPPGQYVIKQIDFQRAYKGWTRVNFHDYPNLTVNVLEGKMTYAGDMNLVYYDDNWFLPLIDYNINFKGSEYKESIKRNHPALSEYIVISEKN